MKSLSCLVGCVACFVTSAYAGILVEGELAIGGGAVANGVQYPWDTIVSFRVRNASDQTISIPTYNLTVTSEEADGFTLLTISIPESLTSDGRRVPVSKWSLGIVSLPPGEEGFFSVQTSTAINPRIPTKVVLRIDAESSRRYGLLEGDHEITIPPFLSAKMLAELKEESERMQKRKEKKAAEPGATDNPDDAQRLRENH